ncbi:hypothetical protein PRUPE_3G229200 [Prunus persica]|uniref:Uncharacterized protein n=1 Tax=Prunus persica TaxID=3760 RepID=M5XI32_PRUPE|nr:hypothetical protein PRUPE_3G229200 [Prunus persica]
MTFGEQITFLESFGLLDQAFLSGINFFDFTEMYPVVQRTQTQVRGGARSVVLATKMTWIRDGPKCSNAKNITKANVGRLNGGPADARLNLFRGQFSNCSSHLLICRNLEY